MSMGRWMVCTFYYCSINIVHRSDPNLPFEGPSFFYSLDQMHKTVQLHKHASQEFFTLLKTTTLKHSLY